MSGSFKFLEKFTTKLNFGKSITLKRHSYQLKRHQSTISHLQSNITDNEFVSPAVNIFPIFIKDLTENSVFEKEPDFKMRYQRMIEYSLLVGNKEVPCMTVMCYKTLERPEKLNEETINQAYLLGWLGEMIQSIMYMASDKINNVETRNNSKTWHSLDDVGLLVANDTCLLQTSIFILLKKYFKDHPNYPRFIELFHSCLYTTFQGHNLELISKDINGFHMNVIERIAKYKIATGCFNWPLKCAVYLANLDPTHYLDQGRNIIEEIAVYKKIKADFLDSFGNHPQHVNIKQGYCSWLAVKLLETCNSNQQTSFKENYGKIGENSIDEVISLYNAVKLPVLFETYKIKKNVDITKKIGLIEDEDVKRCLTNFWNQTF
ncbi:uncharacterized protein [Diabrotica undecimpunctata]|uniref:uncharacterized protein n=1 Tax=Diabrotica undecimpunctata TaxID=50387 RepID=UPI003B636E4E